MKPSCVSLFGLLLGTAILTAPLLVWSQADGGEDASLDFSGGVRKQTPALPGAARMSSELNELSAQFTSTRGETPQIRYTSNQLQKQFGITRGEKRPEVEVAIRMTGGTDTSALIAAGAQIWFVAGDLVYARVPVGELRQIARLQNVASVRSIAAASLPPTPKTRVAPQIKKVRGAVEEDKLADKFDHQGLTGKGVIVGVIDSGIDWRHQDFIRPDGTTRILYLYDPFDNSWQESNGTIGSAPPYTLKGIPYGTVYTAGQINQTLAGSGTVNSTDTVGHGTACAGTAAGNGRATGNGVPAGIYRGVASEADLIIVRLLPNGSTAGKMTTATAVNYIVSKARAEGRPCVINMSYGGHYTAHDGNDPEELALDSFLGAGKPGIAAVVSAGNERQDNLHAAGRFGAPDQPDRFSASSELFVSEITHLFAYFRSEDDWGIEVTGLDNFFVGEDENPVHAYIFRSGDSFDGLALSNGQKYSGYISKFNTLGVDGLITPPANFQQYLESCVSMERLDNDRDKLSITLPPGKYLVQGFGRWTNVVKGEFDLYVRDASEASFGRGVRANVIVGSPGNSARAITVGSYDFRREWPNAKGTTTAYNLQLGDISDYSSPGFRLDGVIKPEIAAPAQYTISPLAKDCRMGNDEDGPNLVQITGDGEHIAWCGTSAAAPYVTGVVALMLQKNSNLDSDQIKKILIETARKDEFTGAVPNREWGYGKIDPAAALARTPPATSPNGKPDQQPPAK
jgi:minor extracellular serine protease Vpr